VSDALERKAGDESKKPDQVKEFLNTFFGRGRYPADPTDPRVMPQHFVARGEGEDLPAPRRIRFDPERDVEGTAEETKEIEK